MRVTILLAAVVLLPGCLGCFDLEIGLGSGSSGSGWGWETEEVWVQPDTGEWVWVPSDAVAQIDLECTREGLVLDGKLQVSSDPMTNIYGDCAETSLETWGAESYEACCDDYCCTWDPPSHTWENDVWVAYDVGPGDGACTNSSQCPPGEGCFEAEKWGICRRAFEGEPCHTGLHCLVGLYCGTDNICYKQVKNEYDACPPVDGSCEWPLQCVCNAPQDCQCHDGSLGDPCHSDTCQSGLFCGDFVMAQGRIVGPGKCYAGDKGDPCVADWQCDAPLACGFDAKPPACTLYLAVGEVCAPDALDDDTRCLPELVCNQAVEPWECRALGTNGDPCQVDIECADYHSCVPLFGVCSDGLAGSACDEAVSCQAGHLCLGEEAAGFRCYAVTGPGGACGAEDDLFSVCADGLFCAPSVGLCQAGTKDDPCVVDADCAAGFLCIEATGTCHDGVPGSPCNDDEDCAGESVCRDVEGQLVCVELLEEGEECGTPSPFVFCSEGLVCSAEVEPPRCLVPGGDEWPCEPDGESCKEGFHCLESHSACFDGDEGDPCDLPEHCQAVHRCDGESGTCLFAGDGAACSADDQCAAGYFCMLALGECFDGSEGDPCFADSDCPESHACLEESGTCTAGAIGSPCEGDGHCTEGLFCLPAGEGTACTLVGGEGEACGAQNPFVICADGLGCNEGFDPPQCSAPGGDEHPCWEETDCLEGFLCLTAFGACYDGNEGDPCLDESHCGEAFECIDGACWPLS